MRALQITTAATALMATAAVAEPCVGAPPKGGPCAGLNCSGSTTLAASQCAAWQDLWDATQGDSWRSTKGGRSTRTNPCNIHHATSVWSVVTYCIGNDLVSLSLSSNGLKGTLPDSIGLFTGLRFLELPNNNEPLGGSDEAKALHGTIPSTIANLTNLEVLDLGGSDWISGTIPSAIGGLTKLKSLRLHHNRLNGTIPQAFGALSELNSMYLYNNHLIGRVPPLDFQRIGKYCGIGGGEGLNDGNRYCTPLPSGASKCNLEGGIKTEGDCPPAPPQPLPPPLQ